ncbi:hypothetical protein BESB_009410 [Besnoitia besnoiti]|uniref:CSC1/OSCA1-like 7TM region domain-containing protein n=1 Tax=Besnoitia besnoiti TaxID=94643 RepID=A0A2A9MKW5_BESBE|nr:hypothetical protein BESB_009410 [Besnoitia besnoiti]PFH38599.1 hypothetical protein BESB_009410 [Besnoitia besnoiti]
MEAEEEEAHAHLRLSRARTAASSVAFSAELAGGTAARRARERDGKSCSRCEPLQRCARWLLHRASARPLTGQPRRRLFASLLLQLLLFLALFAGHALRRRGAHEVHLPLPPCGAAAQQAVASGLEDSVWMNRHAPEAAEDPDGRTRHGRSPGSPAPRPRRSAGRSAATSSSPLSSFANRHLLLGWYADSPLAFEQKDASASRDDAAAASLAEGGAAGDEGHFVVLDTELRGLLLTAAVDVVLFLLALLCWLRLRRYRGDALCQATPLRFSPFFTQRVSETAAAAPAAASAAASASLPRAEASSEPVERPAAAAQGVPLEAMVDLGGARDSRAGRRGRTEEGAADAREVVERSVASAEAPPGAPSALRDLTLPLPLSPLLSPLEQARAEDSRDKPGDQDLRQFHSDARHATAPLSPPSPAFPPSSASLPSPASSRSLVSPSSLPPQAHAGLQRQGGRESCGSSPRPRDTFEEGRQHGGGEAAARAGSPLCCCSRRVWCALLPSPCMCVKATGAWLRVTWRTLREIYLSMEAPFCLLHRKSCTGDPRRAGATWQSELRPELKARDIRDRDRGAGDGAPDEGDPCTLHRGALSFSSRALEDGPAQAARDAVKPSTRDEEAKSEGRSTCTASVPLSDAASREFEAKGSRRQASGAGGPTDAARERSGAEFPEYMPRREEVHDLDFDCLSGDMAAYLHFLRTANACCKALGLAGVLILIPLYVTGETRGKGGVYTLLDLCTAVDKTSRLVLWSMFAVSWMFSAMIYYAVYHFWRYLKVIRARGAPSRTSAELRACLPAVPRRRSRQENSQSGRVIGRPSPGLGPVEGPCSPSSSSSISTAVFPALPPSAPAAAALAAPGRRGAGESPSSSNARLPPASGALGSVSSGAVAASASPRAAPPPPRGLESSFLVRSREEEVWPVPAQQYAVMLTNVDRRVVDQRLFGAAFVDLHQMYCAVCTPGRARQIRLLYEQQKRNASEAQRRGTRARAVSADDSALLSREEERRRDASNAMLERRETGAPRKAGEARELRRRASLPALSRPKTSRRAENSRSAARRRQSAAAAAADEQQRGAGDEQSLTEVVSTGEARFAERRTVEGEEGQGEDAGDAGRSQSGYRDGSAHKQRVRRTAPSDPEDLTRNTGNLRRGDSSEGEGGEAADRRQESEEGDDSCACFVGGVSGATCSCVLRVRLVMECGKHTCVDDSVPPRTSRTLCRSRRIGGRAATPAPLRLSPGTPFASSCESARSLSLPSPSRPRPAADGAAAGSPRERSGRPPPLLSPSLLREGAGAHPWTHESGFFDGDEPRDAPAAIFTPARKAKARRGGRLARGDRDDLRARGSEARANRGALREEDKAAAGEGAGGRGGDRTSLEALPPPGLEGEDTQPSHRPPCKPVAPYRNAGVAFVVFDSHACVRECLQNSYRYRAASRAHGRAATGISFARVRFAPAPPPMDIQWKNLHISRLHQMCRIVGLNLLLFFLCLTIISPVALLNELTPIAESIDEQLVERRLSRLTLTAWLPPLILLCINSFAQPLLVYYVAAGSGYWLKSVQTAYTVHGNIVFQLLNTLVIPLLSVSSIESVVRIMYSNELRDWSVILGFTLMHSSGSFALRYLLNLSFLGTANEMLQFFALIISRIDSYFYNSTEAKKYPFDIGYAYAQALSVFALVVMFSVVMPLIMPLGVLYFCFRFYVDKYNYMYHVYANIDFNSDGRLAVTAIRYMLFAVSFMQFAMAGFFISQDDPWLPVGGGLMLLMSLMSWLALLCYSIVPPESIRARQAARRKSGEGIPILLPRQRQELREAYRQPCGAASLCDCNF